MDFLHPLSLGWAHGSLVDKPFFAAEQTLRKFKKKEWQKALWIRKTVFCQL